MSAQNSQTNFEEIFFRYGEVPLGRDSPKEASLTDIRIHTDSMSEALRSRLNEDDVMSLSDSYGDPENGDPAMYEFLKVKTKEGKIKEIEVYNLAITMLIDNKEETRRLFRIINEIKSEQDGARNGE